MYKLRDIQRHSNVKIHRQQIPSIKDVEEIKLNKFFEKVKAVLATEDLQKYINMVEHIMNDEYTTLEISAALIKMSLDKQNPVPVQDDSSSQDNIQIEVGPFT